LPTPFTTQLRAAGLRWNKVLQHWEGLADPDAVAELCGEHDGALRRLRPPDSSTKEPERAHRQGSEKSAGAT
jgi:hypothetical protein